MKKQRNLELVQTEGETEPGGKAQEAKRPLIALIIPAYNEEANLPVLIQKLQVLIAKRGGWKVVPIFVNDGSTDLTHFLLKRLAPSVGGRVVSMPLNVGIGRAVQTGFKIAVEMGADVTLQLDGDGQHPPEEVPRLVEPILAGRAHVVVGSRYLTSEAGMGASNVSSKLRQMGTFFFGGLLRVLVNVRIQDTTSGFRAFDLESTEFLSRCYPDDYPEVEAYVPLKRSGFEILEVPVRMERRAGGNSSITALLSFYYMVKVALATLIYVIRPLPKKRTRKEITGKAGT